jgi:NTE family protein
MGNEPVTRITGDEDRLLDDGIGIALSGGGYRAMLFHLGSMLRLFELGLLHSAKRISSVSGGSITSGKVALELHRLRTRGDFMEFVVGPIRKLASITIDAPSIAGGVLLPGSVADRISAHYDKHLFGGATLQDLPDAPRFVINATNLETGSLWRFMKPYMRDYRVGEIRLPTVPLADAVTASSAFPPVLSPFTLEVEPSDFSQIEPDLDRAYLSDIALTDGGVYDNLGLETVYKRYKTLLVSDAGGVLTPDPSPAADWVRHARRVLDVIHGQVSSVRTRQLIDAFTEGDRYGAYWGVRTNAAEYDVATALPAPLVRTTELAQIPTRLKRLGDDLQERLINWGYVGCDAGLRARWADVPASPTAAAPYPERGI